MDADGNNKASKHLIVGAGRCGSSLLAAILAEAGANFGMVNPASWKRSAGAFEHPDLQAAGKSFRTSRKFAETSDCWWLHRKLRRLHMHKTKRSLRKVLDAAEFLKSIDLGTLTHTIYKLDYQPKIILSYRSFEEIAQSAYVSFSWGCAESERTYLDVYRTGLLQLHAFGGCAIDFRELIDTEEVAWSRVLGEVTGIEERSLLDARDRLSKPVNWQSRVPVLSRQAEELYGELQTYKGQVISPSGNLYKEKH